MQVAISHCRLLCERELEKTIKLDGLSPAQLNTCREDIKQNVDRHLEGYLDPSLRKGVLEFAKAVASFSCYKPDEDVLTQSLIKELDAPSREPLLFEKARLNDRWPSSSALATDDSSHAF